MRHSGLWRKKLLKMEIGKVKQMLRSISEKMKITLLEDSLHFAAVS